MNIIHLNDIAGVSYELKKLQTEYDNISEVLDFTELGPFAWNGKILSGNKKLRKADIIHLHGGLRKSQLAIIPYMGKLVLHYHGSDARTGYAIYYSKLAAATIVSTPDLLTYVPDAMWVPNPLAIPLQNLPNKENGSILIGHFPSRPEIKGTKLIHRALMEMEVNLMIVNGVSHETAIRKMKGCDIVIDQITDFGVYGTVTLEALAMGKPVICSFNQDLYHKEVPVFSPKENTTESIQETVSMLIENRLSWPQIAKEGINYLRLMHDGKIIHKRIMDIYKKISRGI